MPHKLVRKAAQASVHRIRGLPLAPIARFPRFPAAPILKLRLAQPARGVPAGAVRAEVQSPLPAAERETGEFPQEQPADRAKQRGAVGDGAAGQVAGERESDGLQASERARGERRVGSAEAEIERVEEQRLQGRRPLGGETHLVEHGERAARVQKRAVRHQTRHERAAASAAGVPERFGVVDKRVHSQDLVQVQQQPAGEGGKCWQRSVQGQLQKQRLGLREDGACCVQREMPNHGLPNSIHGPQIGTSSKLHRNLALFVDAVGAGARRRLDPMDRLALRIHENGFEETENILREGVGKRVESENDLDTERAELRLRRNDLSQLFSQSFICIKVGLNKAASYRESEDLRIENRGYVTGKGMTLGEENRNHITHNYPLFFCRIGGKNIQDLLHDARLQSLASNPIDCIFADQFVE